jgi:hypothetical protein
MELKISDSFEPSETPKVFALADISCSESLENESFGFVPGEKTWRRFSASWVARSICVASPLGCILTLWLERVGEAIFSLMPPKAMTSSFFLGLAVGVEGEDAVAAIRVDVLPIVAAFPFPDVAASRPSRPPIPAVPLHGES